MILPLQNLLSVWYVGMPRFELEQVPTTPVSHGRADAPAAVDCSPCESADESATVSEVVPACTWRLVLRGFDWTVGETLLTTSNPAWELCASNARDQDEERIRTRTAAAERARPPGEAGAEPLQPPGDQLKPSAGPT